MEGEEEGREGAGEAVEVEGGGAAGQRKTVKGCGAALANTAGLRRFGGSGGGG